jgi:hypothetical protein
VALRVVIANPLTIEIDIENVLRDQRLILQQMEMENDGFPSSTSTATLAAATTPRLEPVTATSPPDDDDDVDAPPTAAASTTAIHSPRNNSYWSTVWAGMNEETKALFHGSEEQFIGSLISPHLQVEEGIFKDPRYEKHLQAPTEKGVDPFFPM